MKKDAPRMLIADAKGRIFGHPQFAAVGMKAGCYFRLKTNELVKLPQASRLFLMPDRQPVGYDPVEGCFTAVNKNQFSWKSGQCLPVAAFLPPGYTITYNSAFQETPKAKILPLYAYAAAAFYKGEFYAAAVKVDADIRHDPLLIDIERVRKNIVKFRRIFPKNRLARHLEKCACVYGCPNAQNFFLSRYEAPLPVSPICNAGCLGCISYQPDKECPATPPAGMPQAMPVAEWRKGTSPYWGSSQPRIKFIPLPEEIRDIAVFHIQNAHNPIVSFGQGCEGEPLLAGKVIEQAIRLIRKETAKGVININTNGSRPGIIARLYDAGLNNIRVSMNSVRHEYYTRYYQPKGYAFEDVLKSMEIARSYGGFIPKRENRGLKPAPACRPGRDESGCRDSAPCRRSIPETTGFNPRSFISINYLTMPGFTDSREEFAALKVFIDKYKINMIQWRNLNIDPLYYFRRLNISIPQESMLGLRQIMHLLKKDFPRLRMGYFNSSLLHEDCYLIANLMDKV